MNRQLVFELALRGRGDVQTFRVELPGPNISKAASTEDARVTVEIPRSDFNRLAEQGTVRGYRDAYDAGHIKGAVSIPLSDLISRLKELPPKRMIITYCA